MGRRATDGLPGQAAEALVVASPSRSQSAASSCWRCAGGGWFRLELLGLLGRVGDEPVPVAEAATTHGDQLLDDLQQLVLYR